MKQYHDEEHRTEAEFANLAALAIRENQVVTLPLLKQLGKIIKTAKQGNGRVCHGEAFRLHERHGYRIRLWPIWNQPPHRTTEPVDSLNNRL